MRDEGFFVSRDPQTDPITITRGSSPALTRRTIYQKRQSTTSICQNGRGTLPSLILNIRFDISHAFGLI